MLKLPMAGLASCGQHGRMHDMDALQSQDLRGLTPQALEALAQRMLVHVQQQAREIARRDGEIVWRDAKIEKITFELARLKRWKFGARTEAMDAQQRQLFLETLVEDEADLQAQLAELQARQSPPWALRPMSWLRLVRCTPPARSCGESSCPTSASLTSTGRRPIPTWLCSSWPAHSPACRL